MNKTSIDFFELWNSVVIKNLKNRFDKHNMFKSIKNFPSQITESFDIEAKCYKINNKNFNIIFNNIESILICGMGGSAIGGELAKIILSDTIKVPILINRSDTMPNWVNNRTLVIISSYSGNTYETLESFYGARKKTDKIISISSKSGTINDYCLKHSYIMMNIPSGLQPRCALGYISSMIILMLARLNLVDSPRRIRSQLKQSVLELNHINRMHNDGDNSILSISYQLKNTIPIIYGSEDFTSVAALRFKNQLQENAKMISFCNNFPEINHNEIESWNSSDNNFFIIWLKDESSSRKINKSMNSAFKLLNDLKIRQEIITLDNNYASKNNKLAKLYKLIYFLDWVSYYSALLNNADPILIDNIKFVKKSIN